jgi:RHS repeat-associated protein
VTEKYKYDAYGNPYAGRFLHMPKHNPYGFTGQRFEPETRVYAFAFRDYNPVSMRWMTEDPIRDRLNWYQYCGSDPVNFVDPTGL